MISSTNQPKTIRELGNQISNKSNSTSFEVIEIFSRTDKTKLSNQFDRFLRNNGHFSVIFLGEKK
jgi:hypothetical protein